MQASEHHLQRMERYLYDATKAPSSLGSAYREAATSGASLKQLYLPTYTHVAALQRFLIPKLRQTAKLITGQEHRVTWQHPFALLDRKEFQEGKPQDFNNSSDGGAPPIKASNERFNDSEGGE